MSPYTVVESGKLASIRQTCRRLRNGKWIENVGTAGLNEDESEDAILIGKDR